MVIRPPFFARVAVGAVLFALEEARRLPETAISLPMNAIGRLLQASMHAQQFVTSLAIKGDNIFESFAGDPEKEPASATFYERADHPPLDGPREKPEADTAANDAGPEPAPPAEVITRINYPELSLAQLRARLRTLSMEDLTELLAFEQAEEARAPFLTMLSNRIAATTAR